MAGRDAVKSEIVKEMHLVAKNETCPVCGKKSLEIYHATLNLPYFGEAVEMAAFCRSCGWKHADVMLTEERKGVEYEVVIKSEEDMKIRVVRSSTASIYLPDLGISIEPGPYAEGFVSNIEGVLERILDILFQLLRDAESDEQREKVEEKIKQIEKLKVGEISSKFILRDPRGVSALAGKGVIVRELKNK